MLALLEKIASQGGAAAVTRGAGAQGYPETESGPAYTFSFRPPNKGLQPPPQLQQAERVKDEIIAALGILHELRKATSATASVVLPARHSSGNRVERRAAGTPELHHGIPYPAMLVNIICIIRLKLFSAENPAVDGLWTGCWHLP